MNFIFKCSRCGHDNTEEDIDYINTTCGAGGGCEGYEYDLTCSACGHEIYKGQEWGQFDREAVAEEIYDELFPNVQDTKESNEKNITIETYGDSIVVFGGISYFS
ncbi:hypothetical protein [Bacillus sp. RIT694]|uniref:hypothetical protein n=1 Tax=Bacillus sp. RIT694 TaxID=2666190 RepID=UPI001E652AE1|nr:hypothetical protein [Bacillus sp. RIT694]